MVASIATSTATSVTQERTDKDLFLLAYKEYKSVPKKSRGQISNLLHKQVETLTKSLNVQNTLKKVFKLAYNYVDMQVVCKFDNLEYTNISNLVKLFKYVDKHLSGKSAVLREQIKTVYEEGMSPYRYNNAISTMITSLKEEYRLKEQEGEFKFVDVFNMVQQSVSKMTPEQLHKLKDLVEMSLKEDVA